MSAPATPALRMRSAAAASPPNPPPTICAFIGLLPGPRTASIISVTASYPNLARVRVRLKPSGKQPLLNMPRACTHRLCGRVFLIRPKNLHVRRSSKEGTPIVLRTESRCVGGEHARSVRVFQHFWNPSGTPTWHQLTDSLHKYLRKPRNQSLTT